MANPVTADTKIVGEGLWFVKINWRDSHPHQNSSTEYRFTSQDDARMFAASVRRDLGDGFVDRADTNLPGGL